MPQLASAVFTGPAETEPRLEGALMLQREQPQSREQPESGAYTKSAGQVPEVLDYLEWPYFSDHQRPFLWSAGLFI